jgi:hypothetical protein
MIENIHIEIRSCTDDFIDCTSTNGGDLDFFLFDDKISVSLFAKKFIYDICLHRCNTIRSHEASYIFVDVASTNLSYNICILISFRPQGLANFDRLYSFWSSTLSSRI